MDETNFFEVIERGDLDALRERLKHEPSCVGAVANAANAPRRPAGSTGLHLAINMRQFEAADILIDAGVDLEARTCEGRTALHDSIEFGCVPVTRKLIAADAFRDICSAAILGSLERVRELLDADPGLANDSSTGLSPLGWASFGNQVETAAELIDRGARMDDFELLCAAAVGHTEVGRLLIERGADPNAISPDAGGSALHSAAAMRYTADSREFIRMLLDHGADLNAVTSRGDTALKIAETYAAREKDVPSDAQESARKPYDLVAQLLRECSRLD